MSGQITPLIFIGYNRNGTTWLGNILYEYFGITMPSHYLHYGNFETQVLAHHKYWGDFKNIDNYIKFMELFCSSDFFISCKGDKKYFYENPQPNFYTFFFTLMDQMAIKEGNDAWATKIQPLLFTTKNELDYFLHLLHERYKHVNYISIQRNYDGFIKSVANLGEKDFLKKRSPLQQFFLKFAAAARYYHFYRHVLSFKKSNKVLSIQYEDLKNNFDQCLQSIKHHINFNKPIAQIEKSAFVVNTSYQKKGLTANSGSLIDNVLKFIFLRSKFLNDFALFVLTFRRTYFIKQKMPLWFRYIKVQYFKDDLVKEFRDTNNDALADEIVSRTDHDL